MVSAAGMGLILLFLGVGAPDGAPVSLRCWAVAATVEGRDTPFYDAGATTIRSSLADLRFDTFRTIREHTERIAPQQSKSSVLNRHYIMTLFYSGLDDTNRARVIVTVMLAARSPDESPRKVVETTLLLPPGGKARVCGLRGEGEAEIILVLARQ